MASFVSSDQPPQLTLTPQRHPERFHDLQSNRRTNEYGTRRIRYHRRTKAKTTTKTSIIERKAIQGPKDTLLSIRPPDNNLRNLPSFPEAAWQCIPLDLDGRNGPPAREAHHSSAPFAVSHPFFRPSATTTRCLVLFRFSAFGFRTIHCTTITNNIRPYSSIVSPPIVPAIPSD